MEEKKRNKEKKQKLTEYQKNYRETKKIKINIFYLFSFHYIKHGTRICVFWRKWHY